MREVIVVEGKNDFHAVKRAVPEAEIIITSGFGLNSQIIQRIKIAHEKRGVIVLTDPDHMGEIIRKKIEEHVPGVKHCFIPRGKATKENDIGIENVDPEVIREALKKVHKVSNKNKNYEEQREEFTTLDLIENDLALSSKASTNRAEIGAILGIGYGNAKTFLSRLNTYGISRQEFDEALKKVRGENNG
ncbi:ribonuclease M5 [Alkalicella caledoniensis]|uniref:Ribonuclease M5 n=1 Tax=Alkalicella caledoniensis TaxID=2731377 RepID=A0A7G9W882_ALKCA|nr:ribonuclease M5 [Alkalicella caledoniensis]QNO14894.1 ribonuclease M5 [Alkalicella caledoniensis]